MAQNIGGESIMVNSKQSEFLEQSNDFIRNLPNASWIAIDEEMTGISLPPGESRKLCKDESPTDRYSTMKLVPERYSIIQLGICLFEHKSSQETHTSDAASFHVRRYKFTLFPPADPTITREITLNPSSIHFLMENNMDLNLWAREGIPFCTGDTAAKLVERFLKRQKQMGSSTTTTSPAANKSRKITLTKDEDKEFHARVISSLREWLDTPIVGAGAQGAEGVSFLLPQCNSFLRRSLYEKINLDYPYLALETQDQQIRVWRLTDEERERRNQRLLVEGYKKLIESKIGAQRIFLALVKACSGEPIANVAEHVILAPDANEAMMKFTNGKRISNRKIPLVVHNGLMDLLFLMTHFHSPKLPDNWSECKRLLHSHFPVVYDTKILASDYCLRNNITRRTRLEDVYEQTVADYPHWKHRTFCLNNGQAQKDEQAHDAAYDAYMTGVAFCGLSYTIQDQLKIPPVDASSKFQLWDYDIEEFTFPKYLYGRNKLYFHLSPYTIDFESPTLDPLGRGMSHESTFRVANIDPSVSSRDIVNTLSGLFDSRNQRVNFDIIWVDGTTFVVGVQIPSFNDDDKRFKEHGKLLIDALKSGFGNNEIITLFRPTVKVLQKNIFNLWGFFTDSRIKTKSEDEERPLKRQRNS